MEDEGVAKDIQSGRSACLLGREGTVEAEPPAGPAVSAS